MTPRRARDTRGGPEDKFSATITTEAEALGYLTMHVRKVQVRRGVFVTPTSVKGYPDLTLLAPGIMLVLEVKAKGKRSTTTAEQLAWINTAQTVAGVHAYVVTPDEWPLLRELLWRGVGKVAPRG